MSSYRTIAFPKRFSFPVQRSAFWRQQASSLDPSLPGLRRRVSFPPLSCWNVHFPSWFCRTEPACSEYFSFRQSLSHGEPCLKPCGLVLQRSKRHLGCTVDSSAPLFSRKSSPSAFSRNGRSFTVATASLFWRRWLTACRLRCFRVTAACDWAA